MGGVESLIKESKDISKDISRAVCGEEEKQQDQWPLNQVAGHKKIPVLLNDDDLRSGKRGLRILTIDGGGMRGHIILVILNYIEMITGKRICEMFDLVCGTSTGGLISLAVVPLNMTTHKVGQLYNELGSQIFNKSSTTVKLSALSSKGAFYDAEILETIVSNKGGTDMLSSCTQPKVFVVTAAASESEKDAYSTYLLRNYDIPHLPYEGDANATITESARGTSAAPIYFKPLRYGNKVLVDGGVTVNNPVLIALDEAMKIWPEVFVSDGASCKPRIDCIVSIGTGKKSPKPLAEYGTDLISIFQRLKAMVANSKLTAEEARRKHRLAVPEESRYYFRFNPPGLGDISLDNAEEYYANKMKEETWAYVNRKKDKFEALRKILLR